MAHNANTQADLAPVARPVGQAKILLVDDEPALLRSYRRLLEAAGHIVVPVSDGPEAVEQLRLVNDFDVVLSDITMPGMDGVELLRAVRQHDLDLPVVLMTGGPSVETAMKAVEFGAMRYLTKPVDPKALAETVTQSLQMVRMARVRREALAQAGIADRAASDRAGLEQHFNSALSSLWMAFQPIVEWQERTIFGYEALVRTKEPALPHPGALFDAAERLDRLAELGRIIRRSAARAIVDSPPGYSYFINLHPLDLLDDDLYDPAAPLSALASRVVLEITERASLDDVKGSGDRVAALKAMGFRVAIDDLGAGYAGLTSFAKLLPGIVKLDMSLVRGVDQDAVKRKLVKSLATMCEEMGMLVVAEGVETVAERDTLATLGCKLLQGYLFGKPAWPLHPVAW